VVALNPILQLSGLVAGVRPDLEHGDDYYFYGNGARFGAGCRWQSNQENDW
jgi:hypothetical protein